MKLLALDLATRVGWACGAPNENVRFGTHVLPSTGGEIGPFADAFGQWLRSKIESEKPELIVFEAPILTSGLTAIATARKLMGLAYHTELIAFDHQLRVRESNLMTVKKFFAGSGKATKQDMVAAARRHGWDVDNDDEADALALWSHTIDRMVPGGFPKMRLGLLGARIGA